MPAYNAEQALKKTCREIPEIVDEEDTTSQIHHLITLDM